MIFFTPFLGDGIPITEHPPVDHRKNHIYPSSILEPDGTPKPTQEESNPNTSPGGPSDGAQGQGQGTTGSQILEGSSSRLDLSYLSSY